MLEVGIATYVDGSFEEAVARAESALKAEGFGVLTRIDVKATLKEKLGIDRDPFVILGACNPPFADRALVVAVLRATETDVGEEVRRLDVRRVPAEHPRSPASTTSRSGTASSTKAEHLRSRTRPTS